MLPKTKLVEYKRYQIGGKVNAFFHVNGTKIQQVGTIVGFNDDLAQVRLDRPLYAGTPHEISVVMTAMDNCTIIKPEQTKETS